MRRWVATDPEVVAEAAASEVHPELVAVAWSWNEAATETVSGVSSTLQEV